MSVILPSRLISQERESARKFKEAFTIARNRHLVPFGAACGWHEFEVPKSYLSALNKHSRITWGTSFIQCAANYFEVTEVDSPSERLTWITLVDIDCVTSDQPQEIPLEAFKRKYRSALFGLNYIGMVEPAYFVNVAQGSRFSGSKVCWHLHAIAWGAKTNAIKTRFKELTASGKFQAIYDGGVPLYAVRLKPREFFRKLDYVLKSPRKAYTIGKRAKIVDGGRRCLFKQNKRKLRPGERIKLFLLMRHVALDELAMAGGAGSGLLKEIKRRTVLDLAR